MHDGIWVGKKKIGFRPIEKLRKKQVEFKKKNQKNEASNLCG
jgi:hypothetical protein